MSKDLIRYDLMVQEALKGVVRRLLNDAARDGLPGEHHFYITFRTEAPGVRLSQRMREKYPDEMTVVLQHQFWDLSVNDHAFEIGLSFGGIPEKLVVPFDSISGFFDPSVKFGLKFDAPDDEMPNIEDEAELIPPKRPKLASVPSASEEEADASKKSVKKESKSARKPAAKLEVAPEAENASADQKASAPASAEAPPKESGAQIVSLDAFRKKP